MRLNILRQKENLKTISKIHIKECGEELVLAKKFSKDIYYVQMAAQVPTARLVRLTVAKMLSQVQKYLPRQYRLGLSAGLRTQKDQKFIIQVKYKYLQKLYPNWSKKRIYKKISSELAPLNKKTPSPHETGGAVDVVLLSLLGNQLFIGPSRNFRKKEIIKKRKKILFNALRKAGFTNYKPEWWHWSYGDSGWAWRTNKKIAIYDRVDKDL